MSTNLTGSTAVATRYDQLNVAARVAAIGLVLTVLMGTFAYLGGWLTPQELTQTRFSDGFETVYGVHPGFRRNHAKGVCVSGYFESNGNGVRLSKALVFRPGRMLVLGRFSLGGGQPNVADSPDAVRGLGLEFSLPDGELWRTAMVNLPVFPFPTPAAFYENLIASKPDPITGKPDPAIMKAFLARRPETVRALAIVKSQPLAAGFENSTFHGLNAFQFTNAAGVSTPVRWLLKPEQPFVAADAATMSGDKNYLFDALIAAIHRHPQRWHLMLIVGQPGDPTHDSSLAWPADREQVDVGVVTLDAVKSDDASPARDITFDPLVLPDGISPSDDPLLSARSAVYSKSFARRAGELKHPSPVTPAEVAKGG